MIGVAKKKPAYAITCQMCPTSLNFTYSTDKIKLIPVLNTKRSKRINGNMSMVTGGRNWKATIKPTNIPNSRNIIKKDVITALMGNTVLGK